MEQPLKRIKRLARSLPESDIKFASKYIETRQFDKLLEIVESDIYLVSQNELLEHPKEKFINIDTKKLMELKSAIEDYMSYLVPDSDWI